jgi:hypothetical protein
MLNNDLMLTGCRMATQILLPRGFCAMPKDWSVQPELLLKQKMEAESPH